MFELFSEIIALSSLRRKLCCAVAVAIIASCGWISPGKTAAATAASAPSPLPSPTLDELKNATYTGISTTPITLTRGVYLGAPYLPGGVSRQRIELLDGQPATGDLNGDGSNESVVFLREDDGGTGSYLYMAVMGRTMGKPVTIATVRLGDRTSVRSILVDKGQITLDLLQYGAKDAACCPSELVSRTWSLERSGLVERESQKRQGTLKLASLERIEWLFRGFKPQQAESGTARATLFFDKGRISGSTGCNRYLGTATATKIPNEVTIKASKASNRECGARAKSDEEAYLEALRRTVRFGFYLGDLTLSWQKEDGSLGVMRFAPRKAPTP